MTHPHDRFPVRPAPQTTGAPDTMHESTQDRTATAPGRRRFLQNSLAGGLAATLGGGLSARLALARPAPASVGAGRLVVVLLRGALDGLAAVPALGDPAWADLRGATAAAPLPLTDLFGLHPSLTELHRGWTERELLVVHAVASPYRGRSHFDAQQMLESGGERPFERDTGWLGRALAEARLPGMALTPSVPLALRGHPQAENWTPTRGPDIDPDLLERLQRVYAADARLGPLWQQAMARHASMDGGMGMNSGRAGPAKAGGDTLETLAAQAGRFLADEGGPRVAWLEASGWDTHQQQAPRLERALSSLDRSLAALRTALGAHWRHTTVLVHTEFGRSARFNGTQGTDHGTGGAAFLIGGAVAGGRVLADWPGLGPKELFENRDLRPTLDLRALQSALVEHQFGLSPRRIRDTILPGSPAPMADLFRT